MVTTRLFSRREFIVSLSAAIAASGYAWAQPVTAQQLDRIRRVAIHPAIGVARVGNSRDAFFFGPEVPGALPAGPFKDPAGAVAKQAARFRIFGYDADNRVVAELTAQDADISWHVAVANAKPAWYEVDVAFDVEGAPGAGRQEQRRRGPRHARRQARRRARSMAPRLDPCPSMAARSGACRSPSAR